MKDMSVLQNYFYDYIAAAEEQKKNIIASAKEDFPNLEKTIDRIKNILDIYTNIENKNTFVKGAFDTESDAINLAYLEFIENTQKQQTVRLSNDVTTAINDALKKISNDSIDFSKGSDVVNVLSCKNFEIQDLSVSADEIIQNAKLIPIEKNDTRFYNNIIERLLGFADDELSIYKDENSLGLISQKDLPDISNSTIDREGSMVDTLEIEYLFDRMIGEKEDKPKYLNRILIDLITNQNYRILANGFGTLNSDSFNNEYYVLDGVTIKKEYALESLYKNYNDDVKIITNIIVDNYDKILEFIEDLINSDKIENKEYFENLKNNIIKLHEKYKVTRRLSEIENGTEVDIFDKNRMARNESISANLDRMKRSMNLGSPTMVKTNNNVSNAGYASIFTLVAGIILFGVMFAYLMLSR